MLNLYTEFQLITAQQLCLERDREEPNQTDLRDAVAMVTRWNQQRIKMGLRPWS